MLRSLAMKMERTLFDHSDPEAEARADARAEADVRAGRLVSHGAVRRWLASWGSSKPLPRPRAGD
jgi:predicted transcriptional regulator